jgi:TetR/AcrR family transcriptional regulator, transcriptional repressor for nem operon
MVKTKSYNPQDVPALAALQFWRHGYYATSIEDLVAATGVSRHGLYADFSDKRGLFVAAFAAYIDTVVTPAFAPVEAAGAGFAEIRGFFETQIALAESAGLPGPGCLVSNTMVEVGPHDAQFDLLVKAHLARITAGFRGALANESRRRRHRRTLDLNSLAFRLTASAQGLWSISRTLTQASLLRTFAQDLVNDIEEKFRP